MSNIHNANIFTFITPNLVDTAVKIKSKIPKLKTQIRLSVFRFKEPAVRNQFTTTSEQPAVALGD